MAAERLLQSASWAPSRRGIAPAVLHRSLPAARAHLCTQTGNRGSAVPIAASSQAFVDTYPSPRPTAVPSVDPLLVSSGQYGEPVLQGLLPANIAWLKKHTYVLVGMCMQHLLQTIIAKCLALRWPTHHVPFSCQFAPATSLVTCLFQLGFQFFSLPPPFAPGLRDCERTVGALQRCGPGPVASHRRACAWHPWQAAEHAVLCAAAG